MDYIDFLKYEQFPVSTETFSKLQAMILQIAKLASLGGQNYILSGCELNSYNILSDGYLVIQGELIYFQGGYMSSSYITIVEEKTSVTVYDTNFQDIYINKKAVIGLGSPQYHWSSFRRLKSIDQLSTDIEDLESALSNHISNHTVAWNSITSKPTTFPPSTHSHPGLGVYLGFFNRNSNSAVTIYGSLIVAVQRLGYGTYKLTHNIGHTNYLVLGVGYSTGTDLTTFIQSNNEVMSNYCVVNVSNDDALLNGNIRFCILSFT